MSNVKHSSRSVGPADKLIGAKIMARRKQLGMSQTVLAEACGITFQQFQKYEKGTNRVAATRLHQIAKTLDTGIAWFFDEEDHPAEGASHIDLMSPKTASLLAHFAAMPKDTADVFYDLARRVANSRRAEP